MAGYIEPSSKGLLYTYAANSREHLSDRFVNILAVPVTVLGPAHDESAPGRYQIIMHLNAWTDEEGEKHAADERYVPSAHL